jgi:zinc protease
MTALLRPAPLPALDPATIKRVVLRNGLTVLVRHDASAPVAAAVTYVKAGYFDETDDIVGIAHVLEHMYFKGTDKRGVGEISKQTKAAGGYLNAHTIYDHTSYYVVLPASGFDAGLEVQADAYANSRIEARELEKELEVIIQEAKRKSDNPPAVAVETLYEVLHDRHRIRRWRIGREEGLRRLNRDALVAFYRNYYRPSNTILSIVGNIDVDRTMAQVERLYGSLTDAGVTRSIGPEESNDPGFRYRELSGDIAQTQLIMGWRTAAAESPDTPLLDLASTVLGAGRASRLYRAVRERQLAASVSAYNYTPTELGVFVIHAETEPTTTLGAARAIWAQLSHLRTRGVTEQELERARRLYEARWVRRFETMEGQANYLAEWEAMGDWRKGATYLQSIMSATPEQVTEVMSRYLVPEQTSVVIYRPSSATSVARDAKAFRQELVAASSAPLPPTPPRAMRESETALVAPDFELAKAGVSVYRTGLGVPILVRRKPGAPLVSIGVSALGGVSEESLEMAGLTTLMARTAVKGTTTRSAAQIAEDAELLGGSVGASTGSESFGWSITVPGKHFAAATELLADVVQHPTFPDDALETERSVAIADVKMLRDDMYRFPLRLAIEAAFAGHEYGIPAGGTEESLRRVSGDDLVEWHVGRVLHAPLAIAVVGDLEPDDAAAIVAREFASLRIRQPSTPSVPAWPAQVIANATSREKAQTALAIAFQGPARDDDDRYVTGLIATIASGLGGRFFDELRDRQSLAYTVHAFGAERQQAGLFVAYIATSPAKEGLARDGLLREFARLCETPVSEAEITRAKSYAIGTHAIRQESGAAVMGDVLDAWQFGHDLGELTRFEECVGAVTAERILDVARKYFDPMRRVEGIVRGVEPQGPVGRR